MVRTDFSCGDRCCSGAKPGAPPRGCAPSSPRKQRAQGRAPRAPAPAEWWGTCEAGRPDRWGSASRRDPLGWWWPTLSPMIAHVGDDTCQLSRNGVGMHDYSTLFNSHTRRLSTLRYLNCILLYKPATNNELIKKITPIVSG